MNQLLEIKTAADCAFVRPDGSGERTAAGTW
jgi:hypothetical protein